MEALLYGQVQFGAKEPWKLIIAQLKQHVPETTDMWRKACFQMIPSRLKENSDVLIIGAIFGKNGVVISPTEGNKIDVKVGIKENGEEGTKHFKSSPYGETTTLDSYDLLGGYTYVHIKNHMHVYDQQSTDDRYKISGATCTETCKVL